MGLFGIGKKAIAAEILGNNAMAVMLNADDCWGDVCLLRSYQTADSIATCEMAFARAALVQRTLTQGQEQAVADRIVVPANKFVGDAFATQDNAETVKFYRAPMRDVALERVKFYDQNAFPISQLAATIGAALGVPGIPSVEAAFLFEKVETRVREITGKYKVV